MTLSEKQQTFAVCLAKLVAWAVARGYAITFAEVYRFPWVAEELAKQGKGIKNSVHCQRLAADLNLFKDGAYLTDSESYRPLGDFWKTLHADARWGGDFPKLRDGNHFSFEHQGIK